MIADYEIKSFIDVTILKQLVIKLCTFYILLYQYRICICVYLLISINSTSTKDNIYFRIRTSGIAKMAS